MKWILASTTALALTMGTAQITYAQDTAAPDAVDSPAVPQDNDTLIENQAVTPETGTTATETAPVTDPDMSVTMDHGVMPAEASLSVRDVVGADAIGPNGETVGTIDDLVLDADGKIERVIIADGSILGFGGKNVALSYAGADIAREANGTDPVVRINMTEEALDGAAEFDKSQLEDQGDRLASSYLGRDVRLASSDGEGEINDLLLDQGGMVKFAVIEFGGVLGIGDKEAVVAFDKLSGAPEGDPMQLSMSEAELEAAPNFDDIQPAAGN